MDDDPSATSESERESDSEAVDRTGSPPPEERTRRDSSEHDSGDVPDFGRYACYEDDGGTVICDRHNPAAWVRSDHLVDLAQ